MATFTYDALPGRIVFGPGTARNDLTSEIERLNADRIVLIASGSEADMAAELSAPFANRVIATFTDVRPHVPIDVAERARRAAADANVVVSIGGGSTTGTAKAVALTTGLPIVAVPTTYAGSEVTPVWGLTTDGTKTTGSDAAVLPRTVIYDPELTLTLPPEVSMASGLNALAHCVEAFWAPHRNPVSSALAQDGIRHLVRGITKLSASTDELVARTDLLLGAYLAGSAFAVAGSGLHHKICHALGGAFDLPHAQTHAVVLPHVTAFNLPQAPEAHERISTALGRSDVVQTLLELNHTAGIPYGLRALGLTESDTESIVGDVLAIAPTDNPTPVTHASLTELLRAAWAGAAHTKNQL